jgi:hypothetical protein
MFTARAMTAAAPAGAYTSPRAAQVARAGSGTRVGKVGAVSLAAGLTATRGLRATVGHHRRTTGAVRVRAVGGDGEREGGREKDAEAEAEASEKDAPEKVNLLDEFKAGMNFGTSMKERFTVGPGTCRSPRHVHAGRTLVS